MKPQTRLIFIIFILLGAAALRLADLTQLPPGLHAEEIVQISISEAVSNGAIASFYNVGDPSGGRAGLFGILLAASNGLFGNGLLPLRMFSVFLGLISVALMYALGKRLFGITAGLVSAAGMAFTLWPILAARSVTSDALLLATVLMALLAMVSALHLRQMVEPEAPITQTYALLGVSVAITMYVGWVGLFVPLLMVAYVVYLITTRQPISRRVIGFAGFALLVVIISTIPYLTFTLRTFSLSGVSRLWAVRPPDVQSLLASFVNVPSSIFAAGDPNITQNAPGAALLHPALFFLFLIGLVGALRLARRPNMALMLLTLIIGLLPDIWASETVSFAEQIIALPAVFGLIGLGADILLGEVMALVRFRLLRVAVGLLAVIAVGGGFADGADRLVSGWTARPEIVAAYNAPLGHLAAYLDRTPDGVSTSICTFSLAREEALRPGEIPGAIKPDPALLRLMLHRPNPDLRFCNCVSSIVLAQGGARQRFAYADTVAPESVAPPLRAWLANPEPIAVRGLPAHAVQFITAEQVVADDFGQVTQSRAWWPDSVGAAQPATLPIRMGGYLTFGGYRIAPEGPYKPGDTITLITYWRADGSQVPSLRLFAHVLRNPNTEPALQNDLLSLDTAFLRDRDVFIQVITIPLPADFPTGDYYLSVGAYNRQTGQRLPIYDQNVERGDRLFLDRIVVQ